jgi:hypothetical protein
MSYFQSLLDDEDALALRGIPPTIASRPDIGGRAWPRTSQRQ